MTVPLLTSKEKRKSLSLLRFEPSSTGHLHQYNSKACFNHLLGLGTVALGSTEMELRCGVLNSDVVI